MASMTVTNLSITLAAADAEPASNYGSQFRL
jgi:hypothetical protein